MPDEAPVITATGPMLCCQALVVSFLLSVVRDCPRFGAVARRPGGMGPLGSGPDGVLLGEDSLGDLDCRHCLGPSGVEGEVDDRLLELGFGEAVLLGESQVPDELL